MQDAAVLFAGGTGTVGRRAVEWFRKRNPEVPVLVGGRSAATAGEVADTVGTAEGLVIDMDRERMGLGHVPPLAAVVVLAPDDGLHGLALAQDQQVPYLNIGNGLVELGPELAAFAHRPQAAPVVLASHWMAGASTFLALRAGEAFSEVRSITIGALFDEEDEAGPLALHDMERLQRDAPAALVFASGRRSWVSGAAAAGTIQTIDGRTVAADAYAPLDVTSLYAATRAPDIRFDLAAGTSSSRRRGGAPAAEMVVEVRGRDDEGHLGLARWSLELAAGQASLTGLCVTLSLEVALGSGGGAPLGPGLYLPELLWAPQPFLSQLAASGAVVTNHSDQAPAA
ncbi:hypothetical protein [Auraticoccus monumenti]|uniref:Saccharopine dehydrogenase NADP binding domain-containing protein n=1 Tax=Auraticoccus monumenti TaxID=675864 RepID=A0A1G6WQV1_9ACTN|nr:hypothetical protein [Auraticoccus monumenti]SDD68033.1 hypothetical protein SAMN04489747_1504 [Auraticoccus monumenti]